MCVELHVTDVINLQNEMQTYHEDMEGIPEYIKKNQGCPEKIQPGRQPCHRPYYSPLHYQIHVV